MYFKIAAKAGRPPLAYIQQGTVSLPGPDGLITLVGAGPGGDIVVIAPAPYEQYIRSSFTMEAADPATGTQHEARVAAVTTRPAPPSPPSESKAPPPPPPPPHPDPAPPAPPAAAPIEEPQPKQEE